MIIAPTIIVVVYHHLWVSIMVLQFVTNSKVNKNGSVYEPQVNSNCGLCRKVSGFIDAINSML